MYLNLMAELNDDSCCILLMSLHMNLMIISYEKLTIQNVLTTKSSKAKDVDMYRVREIDQLSAKTFKYRTSVYIAVQQC